MNTETNLCDITHRRKSLIISPKSLFNNCISQEFIMIPLYRCYYPGISLNE